MESQERRAAVSALVRDPKALIPAVLVLAGILGAGSYMGLTIEPESATANRVKNAILTERISNMEALVADLEESVEDYKDRLIACEVVLNED